MNSLTTGCQHLGIEVSDVNEAHRWLAGVIGLPEAWPPMGSDQVVSAGITAGNNWMELEQWAVRESSGRLISRVGVSLSTPSATEALELLSRRGFRGRDIREFHPPNYSKVAYRFIDLPELSSERLLVYLSEEVLEESGDPHWPKTLLDRVSGGPHAVQRLHEIRIETSDWMKNRELWARIADPVPEVEPGLWRFDNQPGLRIAPGTIDELRRLTFEVPDPNFVETRLVERGLEMFRVDGMVGVKHPEGLEVCFVGSPATN